jgi:hypothetical protein
VLGIGGRMDPVTIGAVLLAVITGTSEALGGQLWAGVVSLVRRPLRHRAAAGNEAAVVSGEAELLALQQAPDDQQKAVALAESMLARAATDAEFDQALKAWWDQAEPVRARIANTVTNTISGGTQQGPVLQGQNFSGMTFGAAPPSPSPPQSPDTP